MFRMQASDCNNDIDPDMCPFRDLGWVINKTRPTASKWGDTRLFFKHDKYED